MAYQAMVSAGLPVDQVFIKAGIAMTQLGNDAVRTPYEAQQAFWQALQEISGDPHIGLHLGEHLPLYRGQVLEYLFSSSLTFGDGLRRALAYQRLVSDAIAVRLVVEDQQAWLMDMADSEEQRHFAECLVVAALKFFKFITDGQFSPLEVHFTHVEGAPVTEYERVYGCPVTLGCGENRVYFNRDILDYKVWHAEPGLLRLHEQMANEKLAELARLDLVAEVKRAIGAMLESGNTSVKAVATHLNMPPRRLRWQLAEANTSFNLVLVDYRSRLSRRLLARTDESIEQIVYLTGFSEPSTFYRAFKRWTNETPLEYRRRKREA
jgi:AraC-like DNA-binding protein